MPGKQPLPRTPGKHSNRGSRSGVAGRERAASEVSWKAISKLPLNPSPRRGAFAPLSRRAGLGVPARGIGNLLEVRADHPGLAEILGIPDLRDDREPRITVWGVHHMKVLGQVRVRAVRNAVFAGVACP